MHPKYTVLTMLGALRKGLACLALFLVLRNLRRISPSENLILKRPLLLIAHPDDESMFFSPFLYSNSAFILCLSNGNFDSEGARREKELEDLCRKRNWRFKIMKYSDNGDWITMSIVADLVDSCLDEGARTIVTFDRNGVSGHKNHVSCYHAAEKLRELCGDKRFLSFYFLKTTSIFEKYLLGFRKASYSIPLHSQFGFSNMLHHRSQLRWFRYVYCLFSNYMHFNTFEK